MEDRPSPRLQYNFNPGRKEDDGSSIFSHERRTTSGEGFNRDEEFLIKFVEPLQFEKRGQPFPSDNQPARSRRNYNDQGSERSENTVENVAITSKDHEGVRAVRSQVSAAPVSKNTVTSSKGRFYSRNASPSIRGMSGAGRAMEARSIDRRSWLFSDGGTGVRRKRYTNYYSSQSVIPMAYVHIQPAYPVAPPPPANRKCVRCMVVYKPCPPHQRTPPVITVQNRYQDVAMKWHGLKYGESIHNYVDHPCDC